MAQNNTENRVALVTGAFSGIGLAVSLRLAQEGWTVYGAGRNLAKSSDLVAQAQALGLQIKPLLLDMTDEASIQTALQHIEQASGRLDLLVNNAGGSFVGAVTDSSNRQMRQIFETNVIGAVAVTRAALPLMLKHHWGRVINLSSALGKFAFPGVGLYASTKFALEGLSDAMRLEFKILGPDFHVSLIEPGFIKTPFAENSSAAEYAAQTRSPFGSAFVAFVAQNVKAQIEAAPGPEVVAELVSKAARARTPKSRYTLSGPAAMLILLHRLLPDSMFDNFVLTGSRLREYLASRA